MRKKRYSAPYTTMIKINHQSMMAQSPENGVNETGTKIIFVDSNNSEDINEAAVRQRWGSLWEDK